MGDSVLTTANILEPSATKAANHKIGVSCQTVNIVHSDMASANTTSNRSQEPDQNGSYVLAMPVLQGGFPWTVYNSSVTG